MTMDNGMDPASLCDTCESQGKPCLHEPGWPVDHCGRYTPTQQTIADRWWDNLNDRSVVYDD